ncbi:MAG: LURP-one-related family protein [Microthrixaceae bacterium]
MGILNRSNGDNGTHKFQMHEKLMSFSDDSWIENEDGDKVYRSDGKAMRMRQTFILEDESGRNLAEIKERVLTVRDKMSLKLPDGRSATVHKKLIGIRDRYKIEMDDGKDLHAHGKIADHEYEIERDGDRIATISKKWFKVRDTYGIEILDGEDDVLLLAITICIDALCDD